MPPTIITRREGRKRAGNISRTTEHHLLKNEPTWPRPVQVSAVLTGYIESEITAWIEARAAEREPRGRAA
jgi:predicted DNA-binding transcriptional regulator AlpA